MSRSTRRPNGSHNKWSKPSPGIPHLATCFVTEMRYGKRFHRRVHGLLIEEVDHSTQEPVAKSVRGKEHRQYPPRLSGPYDRFQ